MPTERECVEREREAFAIGRGATSFEYATSSTRQRAEHLFPLPTVTRPRVERDPEDIRVTWNYLPGSGFGWSWDGSGREPSVYPTPERVRLWASLLANPTEEVEA